ncbi:GTPase family protein [Lyngbya confervoides]|uniref:50S ribosome-binding GTPase n=1 Tax=Lyngbya confervoides BDU141951 TaxID=1574623 RepID=A0ABD4T068_9CYAN|nr:GTPase [Lyngbya confervoides]MCM1982008.1 50S ribosome-binding GTPase [Lyngbya confervoides BDU141951]
MIKLNPWQWAIIIAPLVGVITFLGIAAGLQIHAWGLNWIWAIIVLLFVGWRWLVVTWLQPPSVETPDLTPLAENEEDSPPSDFQAAQAEAIIQSVITQARDDGLPWENWPLFFQRTQTLVEKIAQVYHPSVKRPLLNIYVPQAYGLLRGTVDDVDRWMHKLSPVLGRVTVGQAYEAYETYQRYEPAARRALQAWQWSQWVFNPAVALTRTATATYTDQANQQLIVHLGQIMRDTTLRALGEQAIALYSGEEVKALTWTEPETLPPQKTQPLRDIIQRSVPEDTVASAPVQVLLAGRTGAGKSSLINTLFRRDVAAVDLLPSTDRLQAYHYRAQTQEELILWDAPGYEQADQATYRQQVLQHAQDCDMLLLATPALDPALQMDMDFLREVQHRCPDLPVIAVVTQVDRLRPLREWQPPYDWREGDRPKERSIREAVIYRQEVLADLVAVVLPCVTAQSPYAPWGIAELSTNLLDLIEPAKQTRLARFLQDREARTLAAARIIDRYQQQMSTRQGLTALLKSPILTFLSTLMTGSPQLATLLAAQLPLEQAPVVLGRLQLAFDLHNLLADEPTQLDDLLAIWPLALDADQAVDKETWALGQTLVEFWLGQIPSAQLQARYAEYLQAP